MLTVACVWVRGNVPYSVEYVRRLAAMARRGLSQSVRVVCLTDRPEDLPAGVEPVVIAPLPGLAGWWAKLQIFNAAHGLQGRVLYLDLDTLVVGSLDPIVAWPAPFATIPDAGSAFQPKDGRRVIKRFNSSVMVFDAGVYADLFDDFSLAIASRLWGDQDLIAERHPEAATMPAEWFPRLSSIGASGHIPPAARVVLSKKPKNIDAAAQWSWFNAIWRAA